jgi:formate dehydrogenase major subunit
MAELASLSPIYAGCSFERLEQYNTLQWPVDADGKDQPLLYTEGFAFPDKKARLYPLVYQEPSDQPDAEFDLFLNNGRQLEHFHEGNMTLRVPGIHQETPEQYLEISPDLARERSSDSGQWVRVVSRYGALTTKVLVTQRVHAKQVYLPLTAHVNLLTGKHVDPATHTPAFKETAVKIVVLPDRGKDPLRPLNFRYSGKPTPQIGVQVERKWKRAAYHFPGEAPLVQIQLGTPAGRK